MSDYRHSKAEQIHIATTLESRQTAELFIDPINRYIRYPLAGVIGRLLAKTSATPNQVTLFHTILGISSGVFVAQGTYKHLIIAAIIYEIRNVLDCVDGVLARLKDIRSPFGQTADELGDGLSYASLLVGAYFYLAQTNVEYSPVTVIVAVFLLSSWLAGSSVFIKSRFFFPLAHGLNKVEADYRESYFNLRNNRVFFGSRFLHCVNIMQTLFFGPCSFFSVAQEL